MSKESMPNESQSEVNKNKSEINKDKSELDKNINKNINKNMNHEPASENKAGQGYIDLGYAKPDTQREQRTGVAEVIYGEGKTAAQITGIITSLRDCGQRRVLITRIDSDKATAVYAGLSEKDAGEFEYLETPHAAIVGGTPQADGDAYVCVACAGTSDLPVAEEAAITAEMLGSKALRLYDVGVAGIHRLLSHADDIAGASCVVAVAGMEGALASVIGGIAPCPVIAVPTSVGYGASFDGLAALLSMLNSCASGVSVVNIDNGFGAGYQAALIDHACKRAAEREVAGAQQEAVE